MLIKSSQNPLPEFVPHSMQRNRTDGTELLGIMAGVKNVINTELVTRGAISVWIIFTLLFTCSNIAKCAETAGQTTGWDEVPGILKRIVPPVIQKRDFEITAYGAVEGAKVDCTNAFNAAIVDCNESGGGRIVVPKGKFLTGAIHLRSGVELHVADGAEIIFSDRYESYLPVVPVRVGGIDVMNYSPLIYAKDCENVAITGKGRLNGNSARWWQWKGRETTDHFKMAAEGVPVAERIFGTPEAAIRPNFIVLLNCRNILLEDFTIGSGPNWTIHPTYSENITIRGVTVDTNGPNNDGIDPDSCRDVLIENCKFATGDDCVVLKSGYNEDGWRVGRSTENVIVRNCTSKQGHGGLVIGSEMSGGVRNVFMYDCEFDGTDRAVRIKSRSGRGGVVEKIFAKNIKTRNMQEEVIILSMSYSADKNPGRDNKMPIFRDMWFEGFDCEGSPTALKIDGDPASRPDNINFRNMKLRSTAGILAKNVNRTTFSDMELNVANGPLFSLVDTSDALISNITTGGNYDQFAKISGPSTKSILIKSSNVTKEKIKLEADVVGNPVKIQ